VPGKLSYYQQVLSAIQVRGSLPHRGGGDGRIILTCLYYAQMIRTSCPTRMEEILAMLPSDMREVEIKVKALGSRHEVGRGLLVDVVSFRLVAFGSVVILVQ